MSRQQHADNKACVYGLVGSKGGASEQTQGPGPQALAPSGRTSIVGCVVVVRSSSIRRRRSSSCCCSVRSSSSSRNSSDIATGTIRSSSSI